MTDQRRTSQDQFGALAARYGASKTHTDRFSLVDVADFLPDRQYQVAIDVGAGPGFTAFSIASKTQRVIALDITPEMLQQAKTLRHDRGAPQTDLALARAETLPFANQSIDLIACRTAAHHFDDVGAWLSECFRILQPGGILVMIDTVSPEDPVAASWMHEIELQRDPRHAFNLSVSHWTSATRGVGLTLESTHDSVVKLDHPDWGERAGLAGASLAGLGSALRAAPDPAKEAFGISPNEDGTIDFYWGVLTLVAKRPD